MFIPLPYLLLIPYRLVRLIVYLIFRKRRSHEDKQVLKWLRKADEPLRLKDYRVKYFPELKAAIEANKAVHLEYVGAKGITYREVLPDRLFRRGEHLYLEGFCLKQKEWRRFRLDRIKYLRL